MRTQTIPLRMSWIQYSHLQPAASPRTAQCQRILRIQMDKLDLHPPTSGPTPGPINGAALNAAIGTPLSSFLHMSTSVPPTNDMGAENATPARNLVISSVSIFFATAPGIVNSTATPKVTAYTGLRP